MTISKTFLIDMAERVAATYAVTLLSLLITADLTDVSAVKAAALAAIPAALMILKSSIALFIGDPNSASLLPAPVALPAPVELPATPSTD